MARARKADLVYVLGTLSFVLLFFAILTVSRSLSAAPASAPDAAFARKAAQGGMAEVKLGQLAQSKSKNEAIRQFGKMMEGDHGKAGEQLRQAADKEGVQLPPEISKMARTNYDRLAKLSPAEFDREYVRLMVKDHTEDVAEFQKEATQGSSELIKSFAAETLPTVEAHLQKIEQIQQGLASASNSGM